MYVTATYAIFDLGNQTLQFASAGHPCPILRLNGSKRRARLDDTAGVPLGILQEASFETVEVDFRPGDFAFFYTDGVTEARSLSNEEFSLKRLKKLIDKKTPSVQVLVECIMSELKSFTAGRPQHDDLTLVAVAESL
jgi:sigma-B regulation protein RsbU (phosphoserine phosphatase)